MMRYRTQRHLGFTLIELLIVIGVLTTLTTITVLIINPLELLKSARDSRRLSDLETIDNAISLIELNAPNANFGNAQTVYLSLPDTSATCANYALPTLPPSWTYACVAQANLKNVDRTGWIPIDFSLAAPHSTLGTLPVDPINTLENDLYYQYITGGSYVLMTVLESKKHGVGGENDKTSTDGGVDDYAFEIGSDFNLAAQASPNIVINGNINNLTPSYTPGWNTSLNGTYRPVSGTFATGYNSGVSNPSVGYHAHATPNCGVKNSGCFEYIDENGELGYLHRWLGVSYPWSNPASNFGWTTGTMVRIRLLAKVSTTGKTPRIGLYHWSNSLGGNTFGSAILYSNISKTNEWQTVTHTFMIDGDWDLSKTVRLYIYGHYGDEGTQWIDNVHVRYRNP
jgi:prepilin-type N-terminal cleavage/methylation domain-containing protein